MSHLNIVGRSAPILIGESILTSLFHNMGIVAYLGLTLAGSKVPLARERIHIEVGLYT